MRIYAAPDTPGNWGGADVWLSGDNVEFDQVGTITTPALMGALASSMGAGTGDPETGTNITVEVSSSLQLLPVSQFNFDSNNEISLLAIIDAGGTFEIVGYRDATLTDANTYQVSTFHRGLFGTTRAAHSAGAKVVKMDQGHLEITYPPSQVGQTSYVKLTSFNSVGGRLQDISTVASNSFVLTGAFPGFFDKTTGLVTADNVKDSSLKYVPRVGASNLASDTPYNGDFEVFPDSVNIADGWTPDYEVTGTGFSYARSTSSFSGTYAQSITNGPSGGGTSIASRPFTVQGGATYNLQVRVSSTVSGTGSCYYRILWFSSDADLSRSSTSLISFTDIMSAGSIPTGGWTLVTGSAAAPTNAKFARIALYNWGPTTNCTLTFDRAAVIPSMSVSGVKTNDSIQYVSPNGADTNDGLSWATAKATAAAAISAIGSSTGRVELSPAVATDGIAGTGAATGLNGTILAPTKVYVGPLAQATAADPGQDSGKLLLVGSLWNGSAAVDDRWEIYCNSFPGAFSDGSNLIINHSSISNGSGRVLHLSDVVIGNPRAATASLNSNSFAFDNQGAYFDGGESVAMLWEMANTVNQDAGTLATTIFRQNWVPIFESAAVGVQAEYALGGSGTLGVSGNYSGPPKWLWTNLRGSSFNTMSLEHAATAPRTITFPDASGTLAIVQGSAGQVQFNNGADPNFFWDNTNKFLGIGTSTPGVPLDIKTTGSGAFPQLLIENGATGGGTAYIGLTDSGNGAGGNKLLISSTTSSTGALFALDFTNGRLGIGTASPAFGLDVNGTVNTSAGYRYNGGATSGHVLRGNGTQFVDAALAAVDLSNGVTGSGAVVLATAPTVSSITSSGQIAAQLSSPGNTGGILMSVPSFIDMSNNTSGQGGYVQSTSDASNVTGYGEWITNNAFWNGTNWIQPRGVGTSSSGFTANHHKGFSFNRAAASGTNNSIITWTEVANIDSTGLLVLANVARVATGGPTAPAYSFSAETNSGWYRAGVGDFRFAVAGSDHCRIEAGDFTISTNDLFRWGSGGVTGADTAFSRVAAGVVALGNASAVGDSTGTLQLKRLKATGGTALAAANFTLTGWGSTATIGSIAGTDAAFTFLVTSNGTGQVVNPNVRITFADGTWTNTPIIVICGLQGNAAVCQWEIQAPSATGATLVFLGTPSATGTYGANVIVIGR